MIKKIKKPNINFKFILPNNGKFYYDEENKEYFIETNDKSKFYFNLNGSFHRIGKPAINYFNEKKMWIENGRYNRLDGPALINHQYSYIEFWIKENKLSQKQFANLTNHLTCNICKKFCKQECFI